MRRATLFILLPCLAIAGLLSTIYFPASHQPEQPTVTVLFPKEYGRLWPTENSYIYRVNRLDPLDKDKALTFVARAVHEELKEGESPIIRPRVISKAESKADIATGWIIGVKQTDPVVISIQLIDLNEVPMGLEELKRPLRLLVRLQAGAVISSTAGKWAIIEGERMVGSMSNPEPTWKDDELHLHNLFVQSGDRLTIYDIVLVVQPRS
jgi:hypothetical protein